MNNAYSGLETAKRYDSARNLPAETMPLWMEIIKSSIPHHDINNILDLGCGTGRFTRALAETFACTVVGVEPSLAMLEVARLQSGPMIQYQQGAGENLPLEDSSVDLVFMSQVFHHFTQPLLAIREIHRVLTPSGFLAIRNGTLEHNGELAWLRFFPAAREIEDARTPSGKQLEGMVCGATPAAFVPLYHRTIHQLFASSYDEYFEKVSRRGLSALIILNDDAFEEGLKEFKDWVDLQTQATAVHEPVDLFIFQKMNPGEI